MAEETCPFDFISTGSGPKFRFTSLTRAQRIDIVTRTADYRTLSPPGRPPRPRAAPADARLLLLSALGASLDLEANWEQSASIGLEQWRQITNQGRDHYVRIVERGYLFPLGHQAVRVDIIERVFVAAHSNRVTAYLQLKSFIRVTKPLKTYPAPGHAFDGRGWPFRSVLIVDEVSPPLLPGFEPRLGETRAGFPKRADDSSLLRWNLLGTDQDGNELSLSVPLVFVPAPTSLDRSSPYDEEYAADLAGSYNGLAPALRTGDTGGALLQYVRYPPEEPPQPRTTSHPTVRITLGAATTVTDPNTEAKDPGIPQEELVEDDQPAFYPSLDQATTHLPAADTLTRKTNDIQVQPYHGYVESGLANAGRVYAELADGAAPTPLQFPADAVGAVATPNFAVTGLSALAGPIGGSVERYARDARVDPADYFKSVSGLLTGKLLGGLDLTEIIGEMPAPEILEVKEPALPPAMFGGPGDVETNVERRMIRYHLEAPLKTIPDLFEPQASGGQRLVMDVVAVFPPQGQPTFDVEGRIDPFVLHVLSGARFISIPFNRFAFRSANGAKPDVDVDVGDVVFVGALAFVNELADFLKVLGDSGVVPAAGQSAAALPSGPRAAGEGPGPNGQSSGPFVHVSPTAVDAGTTLALPSIVAGVFSMQNLALNVGVHVPFTGSPAAARFAFSSREHPFLLTVMAFGGGGFVGLAVSLKQVEIVEASLEFGAQIAFDIGVASGGVTVTGGVYFKLDADEGVELTGFVRITGALEVLGLVAISAEFNLALTYRGKPDPNGPSSVAGTATLRVEIDLAFFSVTKELTVTKEFAGGDPTFRDMVPDLATWGAYCDAFAG